MIAKCKLGRINGQDFLEYMPEHDTSLPSMVRNMALSFPPDAPLRAYIGSDVLYREYGHIDGEAA